MEVAANIESKIFFEFGFGFDWIWIHFLFYLLETDFAIGLNI
jgi:hypothetical protein